MSELTGIPSRYKSSEMGHQGGMGDVSFYFDAILEREVAFKTMLNISDMSRLRDEIDALLHLRSKYVIQVFDIFEGPNDNVAIIMERVQGQELTELSLHDTDTAKENYLKTLWQISAGLTDIHEQGIIHRDIKPQNMMLDSEGLLKILDFGLARQIDFNAQTTGFRGTFGYAAPEQYTLDQIEFTSAIDVYAFAVVAFFLIDKSLTKELLNRPPELMLENPFLSTWLSVYEDLSEILFKCFNHDPLERPKMNEIKMVLERLLLKDQHQATIVFGHDQIQKINAESRNAGIRYKGVGSFKVNYSGYDFKIIEFEGSIYVNNIKVAEKRILPESCVITIGDPELGSRRGFVTFDVSNPEVTL